MATGRAHGQPAAGADLRAASAQLLPARTSRQFRLTDEAAKLRLLAGDRARRRGGDDLRHGARRDLGAGFHVDHPDRAARRSAASRRLRLSFRQGPRRLAGLSGQRRAPRLGIEVDSCRRSTIEERPVSSGAIRDGAGGGPGRRGDRHARLSLVRHRRGDPWREARPRSRLSHRQYAARPGLRPQARHLCGAGRRSASERYDGVASFGRRPTFDNGAPLLEVFLFDFKGDLYGDGARRRLHRLDPRRK